MQRQEDGGRDRLVVEDDDHDHREVGRADIEDGGESAKTGVKAAVDVVRPSLVTVVQESGKTVRRLPWKEGLTLYAATQKAQLDSGVKAIQIFRGERVIERSIEEVRRGERDLPLEEGDVIKLIR